MVTALYGTWKGYLLAEKDYYCQLVCRTERASEYRQVYKTEPSGKVGSDFCEEG